MKWKEFEGEYNKYPLSKTSTWYHREVAARMTKPVVFLALNLGFSANMTTFLSFIAILCAMAFILIYPHNLWVGAMNLILLQLGFILDCADGAVARIRQQASKFGVFYDIFFDLFNHLVVFYGFFIYFFMFNRPFDLNGSIYILFGSTIYFVYYLLSEFRGLIFVDLKGAMKSYGSNMKERLFKLPYHIISRPVFFLFLSIGYICGYVHWVFLLYGILAFVLVISMLIILYRNSGPIRSKVKTGGR